MRNEMLIKARYDRDWTQEQVAEKIGVSRVAYARWEEQGTRPRSWAINRACKVFNMTQEQLGFREHASKVAITPFPAKIPSLYIPGVNHADAAAMLNIGTSALMFAMQMYGYSLEELVSLVIQEMRGIDMADQSDKISRRQALSLLAGLPIAFSGLQLNNTKALPDEEMLPLYVSGIPACWKLYFDGELAEVERVLPLYINQLAALAQSLTKYQNVSISLASQAHQLASLAVLEHEDFGASLNHCKQALSYGIQIQDPNIQLGAYIRRANTLYYRKRYSQQLQNYQEALAVVNVKEASPLIQGRVYSGYAGILCKFGQRQEALRYEGLARDIFPNTPEDDPSFIFTHATHYVINLNAMVVHLDLGDPQGALNAITQAAKDVSETANPRHVELLNHCALVAIAMNDLEQSCVHIEKAVVLARALGSDLYLSDAREIIGNMPDYWKRERKVKDLIENLNA